MIASLLWTNRSVSPEHQLWSMPIGFQKLWPLSGPKSSDLPQSSLWGREHCGSLGTCREQERREGRERPLFRKLGKASLWGLFITGEVVSPMGNSHLNFPLGNVCFSTMRECNCHWIDMYTLCEDIHEWRPRDRMAMWCNVDVCVFNLGTSKIYPNATSREKPETIL